MLDILSITSPIFIIILLGFCLTKGGLFNKSGIQVIGTFVVNVAIPTMLFKGVSEKQISEIFNLVYFLSYLTGSIVILILGYHWSRRVMALKPTTSTFYALGMSCSNSILIGFPIAMLILPSEASTILAMNLVIENLFIIPIILIMAERKNNGQEAKQILIDTCKNLFKNPIIISLILALIVSVSNLSLPKIVISVVDMISSAGLALSLFLIGGSLVGIPLAGLAQRVIPISIGKLLIHPLLVFITILLLQYIGIGDISTPLFVGAILMAAMPMFGIYPALAQQYGESENCSAALLFTTFISFFTLSALLFFISPLLN